jgi:hypothetical protein
MDPGNRWTRPIVRRGMRHPRRLAIAALFPLLALAACGDDSSVEDASATLPPVATPAPTTPVPTGPDASADPGTSYDVATGADDVVISVTNEGGFVPAGFAFVNTPVALVTGDGRALTTGPVITIYPGPLLPNIQQRSISPVAIQQLLGQADELGLLSEVTYENPTNIADAGTTIVSITVGGTIYRHEAYALGLGPDGETDPARQALAEFVDAVSDLPATVGDAELGPEEPFTSEQFLIQAMPVDRAAIGGDGVEPTFVPWPTDAPTRLADAASCAAVPAAEFGALFADATTLTFFTEVDPTDDAEITYSVTPVQQLPGRSC